MFPSLLLWHSACSHVSVCQPYTTSLHIRSHSITTDLRKGEHVALANKSARRNQQRIVEPVYLQLFPHGLGDTNKVAKAYRRIHHTTSAKKQRVLESKGGGDVGANAEAMAWMMDMKISSRGKVNETRASRHSSTEQDKCKPRLQRRRVLTNHATPSV